MPESVISPSGLFASFRIHTPAGITTCGNAIWAKFCVAFWTKDAETGLFLLVGFYRSAKWTL
jgi:hypothetical protein